VAFFWKTIWIARVYRIHSKAIRTVLRWQLAGTALAAVIGAWTMGLHGAMSLALGGGIGVVAGLAFDFTAARGRKNAMHASDVVFRALRAEGVKIGVMLLLAVLVLVLYKDVVKLPFIAAFIASMLALSMAFFANDE
jgi:F0F1-type ATP synthase assembly protein I